MQKKANYVFDRTKERRLLYAVYTYDEVAPTTESVGYTYHKPEDDGHDEDNMAGLLQYPFRLYRGVDMFNFFKCKVGKNHRRRVLRLDMKTAENKIIKTLHYKKLNKKYRGENDDYC